MSMRDASLPPRLSPAGVVYTAATREAPLLADFAADLAARGWRVGGLVQRTVRGPDGFKQKIVATELDTGRKVTLATYKGDRTKESACGFDTAALAEATGAVRRAVAERMDLIVIEKFSRQETDGEGLLDEILGAMAEGIPTLTLVSAETLEDWTRFTGGLAQLVPAERRALWRWWGPHRLYRDLELGVGGGTARNVVIGLNWVLVEGPHGCGLAQTPERGTAGCRSSADAGPLVGRPLRELAARIHSWDPLEAAVGLAAVNAFYNRRDLEAVADNGLDSLPTGEAPVTVVGRFPGLAERLPGARVIERLPEAGEYPPTAARWLLAASERAVITASALVDHGLPDLLAAAGEARVALVGPSTPLTPRLFPYGIERLCGLVVEDAKGAARAVAEGASMRALKPYGRMAALIDLGSP
ncbi:MAG: DUF2478 domain-containing protein [Rhodospirillales bacterium]|nr:DUF2478 domain-containing protein [Rhodospirillales bacterium]